MSTGTARPLRSGRRLRPGRGLIRRATWLPERGGRLLVTPGLATAGEDGLGSIVEQILEEHSRASDVDSVGAKNAGAIGAGIIFESNSVMRHLRPDICLCAATSPWSEQKASFDLLMEHVDATVELAAHDHIIEAEKITFRLASLERVSPTMLDWLRERLGTLA